METLNKKFVYNCRLLPMYMAVFVNGLLHLELYEPTITQYVLDENSNVWGIDGSSSRYNFGKYFDLCVKVKQAAHTLQLSLPEEEYLLNLLDFKKGEENGI